ncbi:hypothetical protein ACFL2Z_04360 [Candidatus Eisenbacteria bacterium]|uniref:Transporter n=1 Tax=Eiseniibacteriota bacterium TaxID=2212470 RepID=A0ABV6YPX4_UNCEI
MAERAGAVIVINEFRLFSTPFVRGNCIRRLPATAFLSVLMMVFMSASVMADETPSGPGHPPGKFSLGAGYERYTADWDVRRYTKGGVLQNRFYVQGDYQLARRLRVGARLGAADLSAPDLDDIDFRNQVDYGFSPFGSVNLNWTPLGAIPGSVGGAIEILFEASAFATYTADKIEGSFDAFETRVDYEAWPKVSSMWEGRLAVLVAVHNGGFRFRAGPMLLQSGAETRTRGRNSWSEGVWNEFTLTNYFKTQNEVGVLYALRFYPGAAILIDAEAVWTTGGPQFKISLNRVLAR